MIIVKLKIDIFHKKYCGKKLKKEKKSIIGLIPIHDIKTSCTV